MSDPVDEGSTQGARPARVLLVCNQGEADEVAAALGDRLSTGPVELAVGDGGDDTLATFADGRPEVVVVAASLDEGDARALIAAMRESAPAGSFAVVLIGDARGPIRNALDAADFHVDRFVARPIAAKALRYAVAAGITAIRTARGDGAAPAAVPVEASAGVSASTRLPRAPTRPSMVASGSIPVVTAEASGSVDGELDGQSTTSGAVSALRQRWEALADAIGMSDEDDDVMADAPIAPVVILPRRMTTRPGIESGPVAGSVTAADAAAVPAPTTREAESGPVVIRAPLPAPALDDDGDDDVPRGRIARVTGAPGLGSRREPLVSRPSVFDEETEPFARALPTPVPAPLSSPLSSGDASTSPGIADADDALLAAVDARLPVETDDWAALPVREPTMILANPGGAPTAGPDEPTMERDPSRSFAVGEPPPPAGGTFARELRRKMSEMAQRLFKTGEIAAPPAVDVGPAHDHQTEIDLAAIGEEPSAPVVAVEPFELVASATYAGDEASADHAAPVEPPSATPVPVAWDASTRFTAEAGEVVRGHSDAAVLVARLSSQAFTGRLIMRRRNVEKTVHFDAGRPVFASSTSDTDRMGQLLAREGKITADQYHRCALLSVETGRRMGEILVERGFLKRRELLPAVRRHVEDIIYSLFAWDGGDYKIIHGDGAADERIRLSKHPAAMVLEGVRRKFDLATLERLLGTPTTVVELADRDRMGGILSASDLSADERVALAAMDGQNDLAQVARKSRIELANVYALAWGLLVLGLATARRRGQEEADTASQVVIGETDLAIDRERVRARHALVADADYFALLGVRRDATTFEIKRAYEAACRDFAADTFTPELRRELAGELDDIAEVIDEAYRILRDDSLRGEYLANLMD
jgi:hypothetical protein